MKNSYKKGSSYEREIANWLTKTLGVRFRRVPMSGAAHQIFDGDICKADYKKSVIDDVIIECKDCKTIKIQDWINQVEEATLDAGKRDWFLMFHLAGTNKSYTILPKNYFKKLIVELQGYKVIK